ncbi:hypothetical protein AB0B45_51325 [Nonomuraea sp. NPDC049152]
MDGPQSLAGEPIITKSAHNAFTTTNLHQLLTTMQLDTYGELRDVRCG